MAALEGNEIADETLRRVLENLQHIMLTLVQAVRDTYHAPGLASVKSGNHSQDPPDPKGVVTAYIAKLLDCHQPKPETDATPPLVGFSLERAQGIADHIALPYPEAMKLIKGLTESLIKGGCEEARIAWGAKQADDFVARVTGAIPEDSTEVMATPPVRQKSDKLVFRELLLWERSRVRRQGVQKALGELAEIEPCIVTFLHDQLLAMFKPLRESAVPSDLIASLSSQFAVSTLAIIKSIQRAHYDLWKDSMAGTLLEKLDPDLKRGRPK